MARTFELNEPETRFLAGYLRQLTLWDSAAIVRLDIQGATLGVYYAVDDQFIAFIALPLAGAAPEPATAFVSAGRLRDVIGDVRTRVQASSIVIPDDMGEPAGLSALPPHDGWQPGFKGIAGDIAMIVDEQLASANARAQMLPPHLQSAVLRETWPQPDWSSLPRGVLHIARQLGFLNLAPAPVAASTNGAWKRLVTPMGQVFARADESIARLSAPRATS